MYLLVYILVFIFSISKRKKNFFNDFVIVIFLFSGLYVLIPLLTLEYGIIPALLLFQPSYTSITELISYSEYFIYVVSGCTYLWVLFTDNPPFYSIDKIKNLNSTASIKNLIPLMYILVIIQFCIFLITVPDFSYLWSNRGVASDFKNDFNSSYKTQLLFFILSFLIILAVNKTRNLKYLLFIIPYGFMDIYTGDRTFLFQIIMLWLISKYFLNQKINSLYFILFPIVMILFEVIRGYASGWEISLSYLIPGEVLNSFVANLIILDSAETIRTEAILLNIFLPDILVSSIYIDYKEFGVILRDNSPLAYGLGGSILAEPLSLDSKFVRYLYPFLLSFYGMLVILFHRLLPTSFSIIIYTIAYLSVHTLFRAGLFSTANQTIYYLVLFFILLQLLMLIPTKTIKMRSI